jgi:spermidine/putrescine transport system substrate-binding protein
MSPKIIDKIVIFTAVACLITGGLIGYFVPYFSWQSRERQLLDEIERMREQLGLPPEREVRVYSWSWYIHPSIIDLFEETFGVSVVYKTFESDEEVWAKLATNASGYDVVVIPDSFVAEAVRDGLIIPLNLSLIPNLKYIDEKFLNLYFDPENEYSVPYLWGTTGIGYDAELVQDPITGWEQLFDFSPGGFLEKYSGHITMLDDMYETIPAALAYLGYPIHSTNSTQLEEAKQLLIRQKQYLKKYAGADLYIPSLANPEASGFWICHVWPGDLLVAKDENPNLRYVLPKEGGVWWIDCMVIPTGALHPVAAHAWINFMCDPLVATINSEYVYYATPNKVAIENFLSEEIVEDTNIYPTAEDLEKFELSPIYTPEERMLYQEIWIAIKTAP